MPRKKSPTKSTSSSRTEISSIEPMADATIAPGETSAAYSHTSSITPADEAKGMTAPVIIPSQESLQIYLVRADLVYRLEDSRSDLTRFEGLFFTLFGAIVGLLAQYPLIPQWSVGVIFLLIAFGILTGLQIRTLQGRIKTVKGEIEKTKSTSQALQD